MTKNKPHKPKRPVLAVPDPSYQPSGAQLREGQRIKVTFDQVVGAAHGDREGQVREAGEKKR